MKWQWTRYESVECLKLDRNKFSMKIKEINQLSCEWNRTIMPVYVFPIIFSIPVAEDAFPRPFGSQIRSILTVSCVPDLRHRHRPQRDQRGHHRQYSATVARWPPTSSGSCDRILAVVISNRGEYTHTRGIVAIRRREGGEDWRTKEEDRKSTKHEQEQKECPLCLPLDESS